MSEYQPEASGETHAACHCPQCGKEECCCSMTEKMMGLATCAKHDLLKEKMKKLLEAKIGKKLDEVAEVTIEAVIAKMEHKAAHEHAHEEFEDELIAAWKA